MKILLAAFLFFISFRVSAQNPVFQSLGPDNINGVKNVVFDPNDGTGKKAWAVSSGIWYCNDITAANAYWTEVSQGFDYMNFSEIQFDPSNTQVVYALAKSAFMYDYTHVIYKSVNGGTTWNVVNSTGNTFPIERGFSQIKVDNSGVIYLVREGYLYKSTNGGTSWTSVFNSAIVNYYELKGSTEIVGTNRGKIYRISGTTTQ